MAGKKSKIDMSLDTIIKLNRKSGQGKIAKNPRVQENRGRLPVKQTAIRGRGQDSYSYKVKAIKGEGRATFRQGRRGKTNTVGLANPVKILNNAFRQPMSSNRPSENSSRLRESMRNGASARSSKDFTKRSTMKTMDGGHLRLFTKNFDARSKIQAKHNRSVGVGAIRSSKKEEKEAIRVEKRASLQESRRRLGIPVIRTNNNNLQQLGKLAKISVQPAKRITLSKKAGQGDVVHYPNRTKSGTVVTCEYDEPVLKVERTIRPQTNYFDEEPRPSQTIKTFNRSHTVSTDAYTPSQTGLKQRHSSSATVSESKNPNKIVITNLHPNVTSEDIRELFGAVGVFISARLIHPGVAEVIYEYSDDAILAYKKYHSRNLDGQPMICKLMATEQSHYQPSSSRSKESAPPRPSTKPVVFTVKI